MKDVEGANVALAVSMGFADFRISVSMAHIKVSKNDKLQNSINYSYASNFKQGIRKWLN